MNLTTLINFSLYFEGQFTTVCNMNFEYFPLDSQKCSIRFGSVSQQNDVIEYDGAIVFDPKNQRALQYSVSISHSNIKILVDLKSNLALNSNKSHILLKSVCCIFRPAFFVQKS